MNLLPYQLPLVDEVVRRLLAKEPEVCLAACPGAGKTYMSICAIERLLASGAKRILVLAHGTNVLLSQYAQTLQKLQPAFTFDKQESGKPMAEAQVVVAIPQALHRRKDLGKFDYIVVDEAHEFYEAKSDAQMVQSLIKRVGSPPVLLLTGSPSRFIAREIPLVAISLAELHKLGRATDVMVELASSSYDIRREDYNAVGDVKSTIAYTQKQTDATLDALLRSLERRLRFRHKGWSGYRKAVYATVNSGWNPVLTSLEKTMVACRSIDMAIQVTQYFKKRGIAVACSHSDPGRPEGFDKESTVLEAFKSDQNRVLVVADRGVLGFDMPDLCHVVDLTGSQNVNRIFQLLCRVIRVNEKRPDDAKLFVKMMPPAWEAYTECLMSFVLTMADHERYTTWDGKLAPSCPVRERKPVTPGVESRNIDRSGCPTLDKGELWFGDFFESLNHRHDTDYSPYAWTTLGKVRERLLGINVKDPASRKAKLLEMAKNGERRPHQRLHPLGSVLNSYVTKGSGSYDQEFDAQIRSLAPQWFENRSSSKKNQILALAEAGECRPHPKKHPLGAALNDYIQQGSGSFDSEFLEKLKELAPHWFSDPKEERRQGLLNLARAGGPRPKHTDIQGVRLSAYTSKGNQCYDPEFDVQIRTFRPDWFQETRAQRQALLLEMARSGQPKPPVTSPLGGSVAAYVNKNSHRYDEVFDKQIRALRPDWFIKDTKAATAKSWETRRANANRKAA